jgi:hypothetical protein
VSPANEGEGVSLESELRDTSDRLLDELKQLGDLETAKRDATPGTPEFVELSHKVEALAAQVLGSSHRQSELAATTRVMAESGMPNTPQTPIVNVLPPRDPNVVLADWRESERQLGGLAPGAAEAEPIRRRIEDLRDEYRRSFEARR